ncbi:MAG: PadR family transcriptional regulator [Bacteroidales bacterium]
MGNKGEGSDDRAAFLPGTLYMLVLQTLERRGALHGYGIAQHILETTEQVLQVEEGALYPALQRMLAKGWVTAEWRQSDNNRRARFYSLTPEGREQLHAEVSEFERTVRAIAQIIRPQAAEA